MTSEPDEPLDDIGNLRRSISSSASRVPESVDISGLKDRLDALELLIEETGRSRALQDEVQSYIKDLKEEHADLRQFRFIVTTASATMSVSLFVLLFLSVICQPKWLVSLPPSLQVPFLVSLGGGSVLLMAILLKGVYRSRSERNQEDLLPESIRVAFETLRGP
jgi:hypothetical protein